MNKLYNYVEILSCQFSREKLEYNFIIQLAANGPPPAPLTARPADSQGSGRWPLRGRLRLFFNRHWVFHFLTVSYFCRIKQSVF